MYLTGLVQANRLKELWAEGAAGPATPSGRVTMENLRTEHPEYYRAIRDRVWENWIYPMELRGKDIEIIIGIKIGRSGELLDREIEKSSGNGTLDRSLMNAIVKAVPVDRCRPLR